MLQSDKQARPRVVHMHIPKTAGTALRTAFTKADGGQIRVFPHYDEARFQDVNPGQWDLYSGHFGYKTAKRLDGQMITVLRHPIDRFISVFYFWRELLEKGAEVSRKTKLTSLYSLEEFVTLHDEFPIIEEFYNRMTWQVAHGSSLEHRRELRDEGVTEQQLLRRALQNLESFAILGIQSRLGEFNQTVNRRFGLDLEVRKLNVTQQRPSVDDLPIDTRRRIMDWVYLDMELYEAANLLIARQ